MTAPKWRRWMRLRGPDPRADVAEEFAFHIEERVESLVAQGVSIDIARVRASQQFGDIASAAATCSEIGERRTQRMRWTERLRSVRQDLRYATRTMLRSPGFSVATVLTIALGIGANTVVFSLLNALLFRPLDAARPDELVRVYTNQSIVRDDRDRFGGSSYADYLDLRSARSLSGLTAFVPFGTAISFRGAHGRYEARMVAENYFTLIGRPLYRGGWAGTSDEAIVSYRFWRTVLGSDPATIGAPITVNGRMLRIVGVTTQDFRGIEMSSVDLYLPIRLMPLMSGRPGFLTGRDERSVHILGRLAPGASAESAERDLNARMHTLAAMYPQQDGGRMIAVRRAASIIAPELVGGALYPVATLVFAATMIMMLIAGVNVAAVLLARIVRRRREIAVRLALGASRVRIARQLLTESMLLAAGSSLLVFALVSGLPIIAAYIGVPDSIQPRTDMRVLGYAFALTATAGILFGVAPAVAGTRGDVVESIRTTTGSSRRSGGRTQRWLVIAQLAMSILLLVVGSALLGSLDRQQRVDPGFRADNLLVAEFEDPSNATSAERERVFARLALERLAQLPAAQSVTVASMAPLSGSGYRSSIHIPGYEPAPRESMEIATLTGGPDLFRTLGVPVLRGRELAWSDRDTAPKIVVNALMARRYWGARDPVGTFIELGGRGGRPAQVIAVVGNARFYSLAEPPVPMFAIERISGGGQTALIRTAGDPASLVPAIRGTMSGSDNPMMLMGVRTMEEELRDSLLVSRVISTVLLGIGLVAIVLASVGLYGVVAYSMAGRSREFGIRMALGASHEAIVRLVLGYGARLAIVGGAVGLVLGIVATRLMQSLLFGEASSVIALFASATMLAMITLVASLLPARRATAVSPASALQAD